MAKATRKPRASIQSQGLLLSQGLELQRQVISGRKDFDGLFSGFTRMQAVAYATSADLLKLFFSDYKYTGVEILVGEQLTPESLRAEIADHGDEHKEHLADLIETGTIRILVPKRTIHTKYYILSRDDGATRVIVGSANLTATARGGKQTNYVWYLDLSPHHPYIATLLEDYHIQCEDSLPFTDELAERLRNRQEQTRLEVVEAWLKIGALDEEETETIGVIDPLQQLSQLSVNAAQDGTSDTDTFIKLQLPPQSKTREKLERILAPVQPTISQNELHVSAPRFRRWVQETRKVPIMTVNIEAQEVRLAWNDKVFSLAKPPSDPATVFRALENVEAYVETVNLGIAHKPLFAKSSMTEALLYVFASPFAHEYMKAIRRELGPGSTRQPRFLYIYGESSSGKSTFIDAALHFLTGLTIKPFEANHLTRAQIRNAPSIGTLFPLVFDDVPAPGKQVGDALKAYWPNWWNDNHVQPQIIMSSNAFNLPGWAQKRFIKVLFDVHFPKSLENERKFRAILSEPNPLFHWFSFLYLQHLKRSPSPTDDELNIARTVTKELYEYAKRDLPPFFPHKPIEDFYDPGREGWWDLLGRTKRASPTWGSDQVEIAFHDTVDRKEIEKFAAFLPQTVSTKRIGNTLLIHPPKELRAWLEERLEEAPLEFREWWKTQSPSLKGLPKLLSVFRH